MLVCNTCDKYKVCHINKFISSLNDVYLSIDNCSEYSRIKKHYNNKINNEHKDYQDKDNKYKVQDGKIKCNCCGKMIPEFDMIETFDGRLMCPSCFDKEDIIIDSKYTR